MLRHKILLCSFIFYLFSAAPAAWADNECDPVGVDPSANLGLADSYDCGDASYGSGVTYNAVGDLFVDFTNADSPARSTIGTSADGNGIDLSATGTDSIFFDSATTATEIQNLSGMTGALLSVTTADGNIDIDTEEVDADFSSAAGVTHGIFAQSTGGGNIDITAIGAVDAQSGANPGDSIGIEARSGGGDITLETQAVRGNQYGILAETSGSGALTVTADGSVQLPGQGQAREGVVAAMDLTSGTGLLTVNITGDGFINGGGGTFNNSNAEIKSGIAMRTDAGGDQVINIAPGGDVAFSNRNTMMDLTAVGETVINNGGRILNGSFSNSERLTTTQREMAAIVVSGDTLVLNNDNQIQGLLDFSSLNNGYEFNNNAGAEWSVQGPSSELGAGTLNNAGTISFRSFLAGTDLGDNTKIFPATVVSAPGTAFTGAGDSLLEMYAFLDGTGQASCVEARTASCLDLRGGSTAGQTSIFFQFEFTTLVTGPLTALTSANPGIVLVDVNGGSSAKEHFVLDPASGLLDLPNIESRYAEDPIYGAVLDMGGILDYSLLYNPDTQQHILASVPQRQAIEYVAYIDEATSIWHTTSEAIAGRQADLRDGATGKLWFRIVGESGERDATPTFDTHGNSFQYEHGYSLDTDALIIGSDWVSGDGHVFGLHFGAVRSRLEFDDSDSEDRSKGAIFGAYGGWWNEAGLSLDGTINANFVKLGHEVADFEDSETSYISLGARAEAGWRLPLMAETLYVQPLATAAYVTTDFEDLELEDNTVGFEDATSLRGALGVRLGGETDMEGRVGKLGYWLTARAWEETTDEGEIRFATQDGGHLAIKDDRSGSFEEIGFGVNISSPDGNLSGYLSGGATSGDDTDSFNVSIGARLNW